MPLSMMVRRSRAGEFIAQDIISRRTHAPTGRDEFDHQETSYPLKAKGGQPRNPA
jgi:hypothetical protein